jgi:hypothetical protein
MIREGLAAPLGLSWPGTRVAYIAVDLNHPVGDRLLPDQFGLPAWFGSQAEVARRVVEGGCGPHAPPPAMAHNAALLCFLCPGVSPPCLRATPRFVSRRWIQRVTGRLGNPRARATRRGLWRRRTSMAAHGRGRASASGRVGAPSTALARRDRTAVGDRVDCVRGRRVPSPDGAHSELGGGAVVVVSARTGHR